MTSKDELRLQVGQKLHDYGVRGQDNDYLTDYILNLLEGEKQKLEEQYIDKDPEVRAAIYAVESIIKSTVPRDGKWREASFSIMMKPPKHIEVATLNKEPNKGEDV